jgi:hypothetical protein
MSETVVARQLGRRYCGIELYAGYHRLATAVTYRGCFIEAL